MCNRAVTRPAAPHPRILLVNPPIADVAAFDMWARPLGLLIWTQYLRRRGARVYLVDCTDRAHPAVAHLAPASPHDDGRGKYHSTPWPTQPEPARRAGRTFCRYGMSALAFERELARAEEALEGPPHAILCTSRMTYWHLGVADAIARCRRHWPHAPIALGGIQAILCADYARNQSGADIVFGADAHQTFPRWLAEKTALADAAPLPDDIAQWPRPALDLCADSSALPLMTSRGCPMRCAYCASAALCPSFSQRPPDQAFDEIRDAAHNWDTRHFAFYDDALLVDAERRFIPLMRRVAEDLPGLRFHMPNGIHYWMVSPEIARLMRRAGVDNVRLSLESTDPAQLARWGRPAAARPFRRAVDALRQAGFSRRAVGVYVMAGLPDQDPAAVERTLREAWDAGALPRLNEFSPVPGSRLWARAVERSQGELAREPLWQNNSLYWTRGDAFEPQAMRDLKQLARAMGARAAEEERQTSAEA